MFKRYSVLFFVLFFSVATVHAQKKYTLQGEVYDSVTLKPVQYATLAIVDADSKPLRTFFSDGRGRFEASVETPGRYRLMVSLLGYETTEFPVEMTESTTTLGRIHIVPGIQIETITVEQFKTLIQNEIDRLYNPELYFTRLLLFNEEVRPGDENRVLAGNIDQTRRIILNHRQNVFSVEFLAIDYKNPERIRYAYRLDGFDKDWNYYGGRMATYTNLPAGTYTLRVRSTNSEGAWSDNERTLTVMVLPPFWKTPLAYLLYLFVVLVVIFISAWYLYTVYKLKNKVKIDRQMMRFFTNISHEIRTPLTLIHTPLEAIVKSDELDERTREELRIVYRNSGRLLQLVNQLLDFRKIQHNKMPVNIQPVPISTFLHDLKDNFISIAQQKNIKIHYRTNCRNLVIQTDKEKIETILYNLLSNALKYTPPGKSIHTECMLYGRELQLTIRDEGVGIAKDRLSRLFIPFENSQSPVNDFQPGTGIGLAIVYEMCVLLGIRIDVNSEKGRGTTVCLTTVITENGAGSPAAAENEGTDSRAGGGEQEELDGEEDKKKTVLIVEDNSELREYLVRALRSEYQLIEACTGQKGLGMARKMLPDIIISDLMMPEMDGAQLAAALKSDVSTSHIPIIILTAKNEIRTKTELFDAGVDDFLTKPFSMEMLRARIQNILEQRERLHAIYSNSLLNLNRQQQENDSTSRQDKECLEKLLEYMNENLTSGDIAVEDLCAVSGHNYPLLYKKLKTLVGMSPVEFIREFRIQRAAEYIRGGEYSMKEIAYMVGFNDSRYFSRCFKQKYGVTPSEYKSGIQDSQNQ